VHVAADEPEARLEERLAWAQAHRWEYLGVVLTPWTDAAAERWRARSTSSLAVLVGEELRSWGAPPSGAPATRPDYWALRADDAGAPPRHPTTPACLVGHLRTGAEGEPSDPEAAAPWLEWAIRAGVALEVSDSGGADGLDAPLVHRLMEKGGRLHVTVPSSDDLGLAVRTARRGWATPERTLNAGGFAAVRSWLRPGDPTKR
jgi:hypothetical protein